MKSCVWIENDWWFFVRRVFLFCFRFVFFFFNFILISANHIKHSFTSSKMLCTTEWVHMVWNWLFVLVGCSTKAHVSSAATEIWCFLRTCHSKTFFFVIEFEWEEQEQTTYIVKWSFFLASRVFFFVAGKYKWIFCRKFLETQEKSAQSMMWMKNQSSKMFVLKFQLIVAFCLINGRFAYREYVADDASDYVHGSSSNISHFNSNEPPGKKIFQNFIFIQNMPIFLHKI